MTALRDVLACEYRADRPYDEQSAGTVHVGTTLAATFDREVCVSLTRHTIALRLDGAGKEPASSSVNHGSNCPEAGSAFPTENR